ncbi:MAG TPA: hypothetical protein VFR67_11205 [Pilimelia sp.]|nr:hypothetical protein [Pilimelia sp.]
MMTQRNQLNTTLVGVGGGCLALAAVWLVVSSGPADLTEDYQKWSAAHPQAPGARYAGFVSDVEANDRHSSYTFTTRLGVGDNRALDMCESFREWAAAREQQRKGAPHLRLAVLNEAGETASHAPWMRACQLG